MSMEKDRQFEQQLRSLNPRRPGFGLEQRIEAGILAEARRRRLARWRTSFTWGGLATAASVLITFGVLLFNGRLALPGPAAEAPAARAVPLDTSAGQPDAGFQPVLAENNLRGRVDEGIVFLRNGLTARRYRYEFIDRVVWRNPDDGAVVEMEIPREEVVLVPVKTF